MRVCLSFFAALLVSVLTPAAAQTSPFPPSPKQLVAVNPVTNKVYVANESANSVTVLDQTNDTTRTIPVGNRPQFIVVNALTNRIFVNNGGEASLTVIDGATDTNLTPTPLAIGSQGPMAINNETNVVYIVRMTSVATDEVTFFNATNNTWYTIATESFQPTALATNPVTDTIYVAHYGTGDVRVISGTFNNTNLHPATSSIGAWSKPFAVAANSMTNKVYVITEDSRGPIGVINGATNAATWPTPAAGHASSPKALAVNPVTNKVYAAFANEVIVIDGADNSLTYVPVPTGSTASIAINYFTNKIYVSSDGGNLTVIDGFTNATTSLTVPAGTISIGMNPMTNEIITGGATAAAVAGVAAPFIGLPLTTTINPLPGNSSASGGSITMSAANAFPNPLPVRGVYYQFDSIEGRWSLASGAGNGPWTASLGGLSSGSHTIYAFAAEAHMAPTDTGNGSSPMFGNIATYNFTVSGSLATPTVAVSSSANPSTVGQSVTFTATVSGSGAAPTGTVRFADGGTTITGCSAVAIASGRAACTTSALAAGSRTITASYSGDSSYGAGSGTVIQTVNAAGPPAKSEITSPAPGSTLTAATVTFSWTAGSQVAERYLMVGTTMGGSQVYAGYQGAATSKTVSGIPQDGSIVYVRLLSYLNGMWQAADYSYSGGSGTPPPPPAPAKSTLTSPANGSTLTSSTVTFTWDAGSQVAERYLMVGTTMGGSQVFAGYQGSATSRTVGGIPQDGSTVYVRLMSYINGMWEGADYSYMGGSGTAPPPSQPMASAITSPQPGSRFVGSTATFTWSAGNGVTERYFTVGSAAGGSDIYGGYQGNDSARTVDGIPMDGRTIYVRLMSWVNGGWVTLDYTYYAAP